MKVIKYILFSLAAVFCVSGAKATIAEADSAYNADDFINAAVLYQQAIDSLGASANRYYNLGNSYYRAGMLGMAIVSYERALRLDPTNSDIRDNLDFVNAQTKDLIPQSQSIFSGVFDSASSRMSSNGWAWAALTCFILALGGVALYFFANNVSLRKVGFFGCGVLLILCIVSNVIAWQSAKKVVSKSQAIVISPSTILSTTPRTPKDRTEEALLLHEGAKVTILDSLRTGKGAQSLWLDVRIDNEHRAWIQSSEVEII